MTHLTELSITAFLISFALVWYSIRKLVYISHKKHLFDEPNEKRKIHTFKTPNLAGVAIFFSFVITFCCLESFFKPLNHINYLAVAIIILFLVGLMDDLVGMNAFKKLFAQLVVAVIVSNFADLRLPTSMFFSNSPLLSYWMSIGCSVFMLLLLMNSFNFIDGINCLAGGMSLLSGIIFSFLFIKFNAPEWSVMAFMLSGSSAAFLYFNKSPARIFLGDSGSLFIGLIAGIFSLKFMNLQAMLPSGAALEQSWLLLLCVFFIPLIDISRVIIVRLGKWQSPFIADRNHLHHLLIDRNFTHMQAAGLLVGANALIIALIIFFTNARDLLALGMGALLCGSILVIAVVASFKLNIRRPCPSVNTYMREPKLKAPAPTMIIGKMAATNAGILRNRIQMPTETVSELKELS